MHASLDITPLASAIALAGGAGPSSQGTGGRALRDGLIQRFEFTYELAHRILRRYLRQVSASPAAFDQMPFQDLIRAGWAQGLLLNGWPVWRQFREMQARTSFTYAAAVAEAIVQDIPVFLADAIHLRDALQRQRLLT